MSLWIPLILPRFRTWFSDALFGEILAGSAVALSGRAAAVFCGLAVNVLVARWYGADLVGIVAVLHSFFLLSTTFTLLGTGTSMLRLIPEHEARYSTASAYLVYRRARLLVILAGIGLGAMLWWTSEPVASWVFRKPYLAGWFALAALFVVFDSLVSLGTATLRGLRQVKWYAALMFSTPALELLFLLAGSWWIGSAGMPVYALLAATLSAALIGLLLVRMVFRRRLKPEGVVEPMTTRRLLAVSLPMLATAGLSMGMAQTGIILLGILRTESEVGYYSVAVRLASIMIFMLLAINSMAGPKFSELFHSGRIDDLFAVARRSARLVFWVSAPLFLVLVIAGKRILGGFFGAEFEVAYPALVMLSLGQFVNAVTGSTGMFMNMTGQEVQFRNLVLVAFAVHISLNLLVIPVWGITGAAVTAMVTTSALNLATLAYIRKRHGRSIAYFPGPGR